MLVSELSGTFHSIRGSRHCQLLIKSDSPETFTKTLGVLDESMASPVGISDGPGATMTALK